MELGNKWHVLRCKTVPYKYMTNNNNTIYQVGGMISFLSPNRASVEFIAHKLNSVLLFGDVKVYHLPGI